MDGTTRYEIRVKGRLSATTLAAFAGLRGEQRPVETALVGRLRDQPESSANLQDLGIELIEVRRIPDSRR